MESSGNSRKEERGESDEEVSLRGHSSLAESSNSSGVISQRRSQRHVATDFASEDQESVGVAGEVQGELLQNRSPNKFSATTVLSGKYKTDSLGHPVSKGASDRLFSVDVSGKINLTQGQSSQSAAQSRKRSVTCGTTSFSFNYSSLHSAGNDLGRGQSEDHRETDAGEGVAVIRNGDTGGGAWGEDARSGGTENDRELTGRVRGRSRSDASGVLGNGNSGARVSPVEQNSLRKKQRGQVSTSSEVLGQLASRDDGGAKPQSSEKSDHSLLSERADVAEEQFRANDFRSRRLKEAARKQGGHWRTRQGSSSEVFDGFGPATAMRQSQLSSSQASFVNGHWSDERSLPGGSLELPESQTLGQRATESSRTDLSGDRLLSSEQESFPAQNSSGREEEAASDDGSSFSFSQRQEESSVESDLIAARREAWAAATCDGQLPLGVGDTSLLSKWMLKKETALLGAEFVTVPCRPLIPLYGMSFLCPSAQEEVDKGLREDVLLPSDVVQLRLFQASRLGQQGKVKIDFPSFLSSDIVEGLEKDPVGVELGTLCPYFFEVGLRMCELLAEDQWPIAGMNRKLREAQRKRLIHIVSKADQLPAEAQQGFTHAERCKVRELQRSQNQRLFPFCR